MSLTKLLKAPIKLFKKEIITFLIIRRYDLGIANEKLRYIAVKPSASISVLRQKVWHLLELPDFCEELIILKSPGEVQIALTELRRGNDPQHPYILEVWMPEKRDFINNGSNNMLTMGKVDNRTETNSIITNSSIFEEKKECCIESRSRTSNDTMALNPHRCPPTNLNFADYKKSEVSCKTSRSSLFKINGRKSMDNLTNLLLKIQTDLSNLNNKLSVLENKISA